MEEWCHPPGNHSKENIAFNVEERDWVKGAQSNQILLPGFPDPTSYTQLLCNGSHQVPCRRLNSSSRTVGQFLDSLKEMPFSPGVLQAWALWINSRASNSWSIYDLKWISGSSNGGMSSIGGSKTPFMGSEYVFAISHSWTYSPEKNYISARICVLVGCVKPAGFMVSSTTAGWCSLNQAQAFIETVSPEDTFCDTVQVPSGAGDMQLI